MCFEWAYRGLVLRPKLSLFVIQECNAVEYVPTAAVAATRCQYRGLPLEGGGLAVEEGLPL